MIDVIYDASPLGLGCFPQHRTGIFNVAHQLVEEIAKLPECRIYLAAFDILPLVLKFLSENPIDGIISLPPHNNEQALGTHIDQALSHISSLSKDIPALKKYGWLLDKLSRLLNRHLLAKGESLKGIDLDIFRKAHIYHTTRGPLHKFIRKFPLRAVLTIHDFIPLETPHLCLPQFLNLFHATLNNLRPQDILLTPSEYIAGQATQLLGWPKTQVFAVHHGISRDFTKEPCPKEVEEMKNRLGLGETPYFIAVGRQELRKNFQRLIQAFLLLKSQFPSSPIKLVLVGETHYGSQKFDQPYEDPSIIYTGVISNQDLALLYKGAMAFVHPSLAEGFGLPIIEAMAMGLPVICSPLTSMPEVAQDNALYIEDPLSHESICKALSTIYLDADLRKELSEKSLRHAKNFSWEKAAQDTLAIYKKVA